MDGALKYPTYNYFKSIKRMIYFLFFWSICCFLIVNENAYAQSLNVAVIENTESPNTQSQIFKNEIQALFEGERNVNFISYPIKTNETKDHVLIQFDKASSNTKVDLILVLDVAANQILGRSPIFSKPTFLPFVFNARLSGFPLSGISSGKKNLNYITSAFDFENEISTFQSVAPFNRAVLISSPRTKASLKPEMILSAISQAKRAGVSLSIETFDGDISQLSLPPNIDAVFYDFFPDANEAEIRTLIQLINDRGLPSFSLVGEEYVKLGALATDLPTADVEKLARRIALHMQEVLLGRQTSQLPVFFESSNRLIINMDTSRQIRIAPSFDVLSDAILINELPDKSDRKYSLTDVAIQAVQENLSLAAQRLQAESAQESVKEARAGLLPQIDSFLQYSNRKDDTAVVLDGVVAENSTDASIILVQPLYVEERWAAFTIEKFSALSEKELLREVELDIIQAAVNAYLNVLLEKTSLEQEQYNLDITRENYRLAQNRVEVGTQTAADLYRWESELSNAKQAVLQAKSSYEQQRQQLNQILNRPIDEEFTTTIETLDNPDLLINDKRITTLIKNSYDLETLINFFVDIGLTRAPELKRTEANIRASKRQLKSDQRTYWLPEVNLTGELTSNLDEDRAAGGSDAEDGDWSIGIEVFLPLFEGGARKARVAQSRLSVRQFETDLQDFKNLIELDIRNNMEAAHASYISIPLAKQAEVAAQKNYELINESYALGAKSITDVLDAQDTLIAAREASMNSVYAFLIDLMNVQRAIGAFDFFLTDTQRMELSSELIEIINSPNIERKSNE